MSRMRKRLQEGGAEEGGDTRQEQRTDCDVSSYLRSFPPERHTSPQTEKESKVFAWSDVMMTCSRVRLHRMHAWSFKSCTRSGKPRASIELILALFLSPSVSFRDCVLKAPAPPSLTLRLPLILYARHGRQAIVVGIGVKACLSRVTSTATDPEASSWMNLPAAAHEWCDRGVPRPPIFFHRTKSAGLFQILFRVLKASER